MCLRYFWQGNHHTYGHIRCEYTVLANPTHSRFWSIFCHVRAALSVALLLSLCVLLLSLLCIAALTVCCAALTVVMRRVATQPTSPTSSRPLPSLPKKGHPCPWHTQRTRAWCVVHECVCACVFSGLSKLTRA